MKRVRILLRVSSSQQLEPDGDLSVQRRLILDYVNQKKEEWQLDAKEYFEGSISGYKTALKDRDVLREALEDAGRGDYDILVAYKDDRLGRRMWEIGAYVMAMKSHLVDIYTVKDGCISPERDDIMGQMMLALRFGNAQKSSWDTGMRVRDTATKLVQAGKFMGGRAPYGYELVLSGEMSKHGRALHRLKILPGQAQAVQQIYSLCLYREYGSLRIARLLNQDDFYKSLAPNGVWKAGSVTGILTNPVYAGYVAYGRRERQQGRHCRTGKRQWIRADKPNEEIRIIQEELWNRVQEKREERARRFGGIKEGKESGMCGRSDFAMVLTDVIYCGYCGAKLTNGTKYSYWTLKSTGEKKTRKKCVYQCPGARSGVVHRGRGEFDGEKTEQIIGRYLVWYIERLQAKEDVRALTEETIRREKRILEEELKKLEKEREKEKRNGEMLEEHIPQAMAGDWILSLDELMSALRRQKEKQERLERQREKQRALLRERNLALAQVRDKKALLPDWRQVFADCDRGIQKVLADKLIDRIQMSREQIRIRFRCRPEDFDCDHE